jgi:prepilin-type processing-associated H-X9-DG protein
MFNKEEEMRHPDNALLVQTIVSAYVCPSAHSAGTPVLNDRADAGGFNPNPALGLFYPVSMGPTENDNCTFCPLGNTGSDDNYCCQGSNYGTPDDNSTGMFGRSNVIRYFRQVTDGLSSTFLAGETLPSQCSYAGAFAPNFSLAGTTIPLNTFEECPAPPGCHAVGCGFKSAHEGGAYFAMADGSVQFITSGIDYRLYNNLGTRAGDEPVSLP